MRFIVEGYTGTEIALLCIIRRILFKPKMKLKIWLSLIFAFIVLWVFSKIYVDNYLQKQKDWAKLGGDRLPCALKNVNEKRVAIYERYEQYPERYPNENSEAVKENLKRYQNDLQKSIEACDRIEAWEKKYGETYTRTSP